MVNVDKGVPLPDRNNSRAGKRRSGRKPIWPWVSMKRGDSFFAAGFVQTTTQKTNGEKIISVMQGKKDIPGSQWATRLVTENGVRGVRVWRVL